MAVETDTDITEKIKSFLIVGETLDGLFSFNELQLVNIVTFVVLLTSAIFSIIQALEFGSFWWFLVIGFLLGAIYFLILYEKHITYAITKFRIIRLERDLLSKWLFQSSRLIGFTDLHYEHVESINVGSAQVSMPRFYISLIGLSFGWLLLTQDALVVGDTFIGLISVLIIVASIINIVFSLPLAGVQMIIQSISGEKMTFPEEQTPADFVDELILNCRTFLSYGAQ